MKKSYFIIIIILIIASLVIILNFPKNIKDQKLDNVFLSIDELNEFGFDIEKLEIQKYPEIECVVEGFCFKQTFFGKTYKPNPVFNSIYLEIPENYDELKTWYFDGGINPSINSENRHYKELNFGNYSIILYTKTGEIVSLDAFLFREEVILFVTFSSIDKNKISSVEKLLFEMNKRLENIGY